MPFRKMLRAVAAIMIIICSPVFADGVSWDYVEIDWNDVEVEGDGFTGDIEGPSLSASMSFNDTFFLQGQATNWIGDGEDIGSPMPEIAYLDWLSIGPGAHVTLPLADMDLDVWGQLTLDRSAFVLGALNGYGFSGGGRLAVMPQLETGLSWRMAQTDSELGNADVELDFSVLTADLLFHVTPHSSLRLAYLDGDVDADGGMLGADNETLDLSGWQFGFRHNFRGADASGARNSAEPLSFNYARFDMFLAGGSTIEGNGNKADFNLKTGYAIRGAFEAGELVFIGGEVLNFDYEDSDGEVALKDEVVTVNDLAFFGPGMHLSVLEGQADLYGQLGVSYAHYLYAPTKGPGIKVGARALLGPAQVDVWYSQADTSGEISGRDMDLKPGFYGLDVAFEFAPGAPEVVLGYFDGTIDIEVDGQSEADIELDNFSVGIRQRF